MTGIWRPLLNDPDDEMVLELAVRASCSRIVTYNQNDFQGVERFGIQALAPAAFLNELEDIP